VPSFKKNLKQYILDKRLTQAQLALILGVSQGAITAWLSGKRKPKTWDIKKFSDTLGVDLEANNKTKFDGITVDLLDVSDFESTSVSTEPSLVSSFTLDKHLFLESFGYEPKHSMKMSAVMGDSMAPTICNRELVLIDTESNELTDGIFMFRIDRTVYLRRIQTLPSRTVSTCDNPAFVSFDLPDDAFIIGRVIAKSRIAPIT